MDETKVKHLVVPGWTTAALRRLKPEARENQGREARVVDHMQVEVSENASGSAEPSCLGIVGLVAMVGIWLLMINDWFIIVGSFCW